MRLTAKAVTAELHRLGHEARLESGDGYFYFLGLEPATCLDKTIRVPKMSSLTLEQWVAEYVRLKKLNEEILRGKAATEPVKATATRARLQSKRWSSRCTRWSGRSRAALVPPLPQPSGKGDFPDSNDVTGDDE
jgi:hypothetical protein